MREAKHDCVTAASDPSLLDHLIDFVDDGHFADLILVADFLNELLHVAWSVFEAEVDFDVDFFLCHEGIRSGFRPPVKQKVQLFSLLFNPIILKNFWPLSVIC